MIPTPPRYTSKSITIFVATAINIVLLCIFMGWYALIIIAIDFFIIGIKEGWIDFWRHQ